MVLEIHKDELPLLIILNERSFRSERTSVVLTIISNIYLPFIDLNAFFVLFCPTDIMSLKEKKVLYSFDGGRDELGDHKIFS